MQHLAFIGLTEEESKLSVSSVGSEAMQRGRRRPSAPSPPPLSVSSVGSEAMQHYLCPDVGDSGKCLSVSSVGSEAMQLFYHTSPIRASAAFSILGRIGGDATTR